MEWEMDEDTSLPCNFQIVHRQKSDGNIISLPACQTIHSKERIGGITLESLVGENGLIRLLEMINEIHSLESNNKDKIVNELIILIKRVHVAAYEQDWKEECYRDDEKAEDDRL